MKSAQAPSDTPLISEIVTEDPSEVEDRRLRVKAMRLRRLQLEYADIVYAQWSEKRGLEHGDYFQRRQDRAHRRYLSAIRTLAQVRRLLLPAVQVNIGRS